MKTLHSATRTLALLFILNLAPVAQANVFLVTNTADIGAGSLRQAIIDANALPGADTINFNIPGAGVRTISPASPLPSITGLVTIDGYTQPGAAENTDADGFNGTLLIELNGTNAGVGSSGLTVDGGSGTIRGMVINRFSNVGINLNSADNLVEGNFIGTNAAGTAALGNGGQAVRIDSGNGNLVGGITPEARNVVSGNDEGMEIRGVCDSNVVQGNFIGTNAAGTSSLGNISNGIRITNGPANTIVGGTSAGARNVISGNGGDGVNLEAPTSGNLVQGNLIGTDVTGTLDLGNTFNGVRITAQDNTIGGTTAAARNVISGNDENGLGINSGASGNLVQGNFIGTDVTGTANLGNAAVGVYVFAAPNNTIGGTTAAARNIISANGASGVVLDQSGGGTLVQGNFIGTDVTGTLALGNSEVGVIVQDAGTNTIGGTPAEAGNLISGNGDDGIFLSGANSGGTTILGNLIGTQSNGIDPLGNAGDGIDLSSSSPVSDIVIGGTPGNTIAFNGARGVFVSGGTGNWIISNSIFSNAGLGIDIGDDGITPNDPGDGDSGPNDLQNFPLLTSVTLGGGQTTIEGTLNSMPTTSFQLEFFASAAADPSGNGEGQTFLGTQDVTTDASGDAAFSVLLPLLPPAGQTIITATATDGFHNTSEFSPMMVAPITAGQLLNISTRLRVLTDDNVLIGGFIINGTDPKQVIVRAIGPSLGAFGVTDPLSDPTLELHSASDDSVVSNDNWKDTQQAEIEATGLAPSNDLESAIVATLEPGGYTAIVRGAADGTGVGLVEAYDLDPAAGTTANISTRGFVDTGDNVMIGGLIIGSGGGGDATVLVRAIGPSLTAFGVAGALQDPTLELHDGAGNTLTSNDDWKDTQQMEIEATGLAPGDDRESAILATLAPGGYTAIVRGALDTTGVGLVEVYHLD